jgi:ribose transport system substrate-binding protein
MSGLICLNEPSASGGVSALRAMDRTDVDMVGIDSSMTTIKALEEGIADTLVVQNPFNMGYLGVATAIDARKGKPVDPFVDTGCKAITKETMYAPENQKLLFVFADMADER